MHEPPDPAGDDDPTDRTDPIDPANPLDAADSLDDAPAGAPPHPMDRVWRHPSEIGRRRGATRPRRAPRARTTTGPGARSGRMWPGLLAAAAAGSAVTLVVLAITGTLGRDTRTVVRSPLGDPSNDAALVRVVQHVRPSVMSVVARDAAGSRRGSGIVLRHDGELLTSAWLVGAAATVTLTDSTGATSSATVVGRDPASGIALVRTDQDVTAARLAADVPRVGDPALVVGGAGYVNTGIVTTDDAWRSDPDGMTVHQLLGTNTNGDDGIGAALADRNGTVTGLVVTADGVAVPLAYAERVADELRRTRKVVHGWLGVSGIDRDGRVVVTNVDPASPAAAAGVRKGDVVTAIDGRTILGMPELITAVRTLWPGDAVDVDLERAGSTAVRVRVVIGGPPGAGAPGRSPAGPTRRA